MKKVLTVMAVLCMSSILTVAIRAESQGAANEARLKSVETLIEQSKAARQIETSGNPEAIAKRDEARALYRRAVEASGSGDNKTASDLLGEASKTMFAAVRMAGKDEVLAKKRERDYATRLESVKALMDTHTNISKEKGTASGNDELRRIVDAKLAKARGLHDQSKLVEAREVLDEAYVAAKVALEQLRGGETLVRALHFKDKEEEYHYELDRNETHRMLVDVLLKEKMQSNAGLMKIVDKFMGKAATTRADAEKQAANGDFDAAVETMELSTKEIVRAIRSAGIYIPG